jgi:hypothetical protein
VTKQDQQYIVTVRSIKDHDDLYIDIPGSLIDKMGWDKNTTLMWFIDKDGSVNLRPPKYDTEIGIPAEFIVISESDAKNDSRN